MGVVSSGLDLGNPFFNGESGPPDTSGAVAIQTIVVIAIAAVVYQQHSGESTRHLKC